VRSRLASATAGRTLQLSVDGASIGSVTSPSTGNSAFEDRKLQNVSLSAGPHVVRALFVQGDLNLNYLDISPHPFVAGYSFGGAVNYNAFVFQDLSVAPSVAGPLAAGRDILSQGFSYNTVAAGTIGALAGRNFNGVSGNVQRDLVYGGTLTLNNVTVSQGVSRKATPLDFVAEKATLDQTTANLASLTADGATVISPSGTIFTFNGVDPSRNVFSVDSAAIAAADQFNFSVPATSTAIVNVTGTSAVFETASMQLGALTPGHLVWNFPQATTVRVTQAGFKGTLLGVNAAVTTSSASLDGVLLAASISGTNTGITWLPFNGTLTVCGAAALSIAPGSPQLAGTPLVLSATATCADNRAPEFHYDYLKSGTETTWHDVSPGFNTSAVNWNTSALPTGPYQVRVSVRRAGEATLSGASATSSFVFDSPVLIPTVSPTVETFAGLGSSDVTAVPSGWRIDKQLNPRTVGTFTAATYKTDFRAGALLPATSSNGIYNFGAGVANAQATNYWLNSTDRAPGWLSAGSILTSGGTKSGNLYVALRAPADKDITGLNIGYDIEKYGKGTNSAGFRVQLYSSTDGTTWTSTGNTFLSNFGPDSSNIGYDPAPGSAVTVSPTRLNTSIPHNGSYYLAWNYTLNSSSATDGGNAQALAIDNVSLQGDGQCAPNCAGKVCGGDGCGGLCSGPCGPGGYCTSNFECAPGYTCTQRSPDPSAAHVCVAQSCTAACTSECPCGPGSTSGCTSVAQCASGLSCTGGLCIPGTNTCHNGLRDGDESDVDCGGSCAPCNAGKACNADTDCPSDEICGDGNGACFGRTRAERLCWKPDCSIDNVAAGCGEADSPCGQNCACVNTCDTSGAQPSHCATGEVCTKGLGSVFGAPTLDVCLDPRCPSNDPTLCGTSGALCGAQCVCTANCSAATCENPGDGCGGLCPGVCVNGQTGCKDDVQCSSGGVCVEDALGVPTCRPGVCAFQTLAPPLCGSSGAICGDQCPSCTPRCDNRQCGADPNCGQSCGSCGAGTFCDGNGQCANVPVPNSLHAPDGQGGQRELSPLPPSPTSNVGALKGQFAVSDEGTPQYAVPIEVPPGRAGMEPALSLTYSGSHVNADEGVGWHLEGLSKITRCPRSNALDGAARAVRNDMEDRFCVDGKRLESISGIYGHNGTEYRTLIDSFSKVISYSDDLVGIQVEPNHSVSPVLRELQGPDWFQIWTKDGKILTYGRTQDSLMFGRNGVRYAWLLNRVEDRAHNTILVQYSSIAAVLPNTIKKGFPNVVYPRSISYTGHGDTAGNRSVQFAYEGRPDRQGSFFQGGVPYASNQRLKRITTYVGGAPAKSYKLKYGPGLQSQISAIYECADGDDSAGDADIHCKSPTVFNYIAESGFEANSGSTGQDLSSAGQLDANGDGIPDFLATKVTVGGVDASPTLAAAQITTDVAIGIASSYLSPAGYVAVNLVWNIVKGPFWGLFGSDPKVEVIRKMRYGTGSHQAASLYLDTVTGIPCDATKNPSFFLDYDQDGKDDVVVACGKNNGSLFVARSLATPGPAWANLGQFAPGSAPVLTAGIGVVAPGTNARSSTPPPVEPDPIVLDVNGDSLQDVVTCRDPYTLDLWLRQPPLPGTEQQPFSQGFATPLTLQTALPVALPPTGPGHPGVTPPRDRLDLCGQPRPTYQTFDVDGDGTPDLLVRGLHGWVVLRYDPVSNPSSVLSWQPVTFSDVGGKKGSIGGGISLGDFNSDGLADVWHTADDKIIIWTNTGGGAFTAKYLDRPKPALALDSRFALRKTAPIDYNADGITDLLENWQYKEQVVGGISINDWNTALVPDSTVSFFTAQNVFEIRSKNLYDVYFPQSVDQVADVDGDGNVDVFNDYGMVFFGRGAKNSLLKTVVDGLGNITTVEYNSGAYQYDAACSGVTWPEKCLPRMNGIVSRHTEGTSGVLNQNGDIISSVVERGYDYTYKNARMNVTGHGWLGFDQRAVSMTAYNNNVSTTTTIDYEPPARYALNGTPASNTTTAYLYPFAGLAHRITVDQRASNGAETPPLQNGLYDRRTQTVNNWRVKLSASGRPFPVMHDSTVSTYDRPAGSVSFEDSGSLLTQCAHTFTQDGYGNVTNDTSDCRGMHAQRIDTKFEPDESTWLISNPVDVLVSRNIWRYEDGALYYDFRSFHFAYEDGFLTIVKRNAVQSEGTVSQVRTTTYSRDDFGNVFNVSENVDSEPTRTLSVTYDDDHIFPETITSPENQRSQVAYDARWGTPTGVVDGNGVATQFGYDGFGRQTQSSGPSGTSISTYSSVLNSDLFSAAGAINPRVQVSVEREGSDGTNGGRSTTEYDSYGRVVRTRTVGFGGVDIIQEQAYNSLGKLVGSTQPHSADVDNSEMPFDEYSFDYLQRLTRVEHRVGDSHGPSRSYQYASAASLDMGAHRQWIDGMTCDIVPATACIGEFKLSVDEEGHQDLKIMDYLGRVSRNIDGENVATAAHRSDYGYNFWDQLSVTRDNGGSVTERHYDMYGRLLSRTDPDTAPGVYTYTYNGFDELKTVTDPKFQVRTYGYDTMGRTTSILDSAGATQWAYAQGRLVDSYSPGTAQNAGGQHVHYSYEPATQSQNRGFVESVTYTLDGTDYPIHFKYDGLGRQDRVEYPDLGNGQRVIAKSAYDPSSGALNGLDDIGGGSPRTLWRITQAFQGQLIQQETFGSGETLATSTYGYDLQRRWLKNIQTTVGAEQVQAIEYTHYDNGLVHTVNAAGQNPREYIYDQLDRLSSVNEAPDQSIPFSRPYTYDTFGNLTGRGATVTSYRPSKPHQIDSVGDNVYGYDDNGNVRTRIGPDVPQHSQRIEYTPFNLPKSILPGSAEGADAATSSIRFEYSADEERVVRRDPDSVRHFAGGFYQRKLSATGTTLEERFRLYAEGRQIGEIVRKDGTDQTLYFHPDHLGSPDTISDSNGAAYHERFDPFGQPLEAPNPELTRVGFTGQQHDNDLGLIDMNGRVYDPLAGRFTTPDPVTQAPFWSQGLNRYSYVFNNPVNNTDPSGYIAIMPGWNGGAAITGSWSGVAMGGLGIGGNVTASLLGGGYGGGVRGGGSYNVTPSASPAGNGVSSLSPQAGAQNKGGPAELASISGGFDPIIKIVKAPYAWYWANLGSVIGRMIGNGYRMHHPEAFNDRQLQTIVKGNTPPGNVEALANGKERPDIYDPVSGALFEIKPEGSEALGSADANYYVKELDRAGLKTAHLGSDVGALGTETDGTTGSFDLNALYHVQYRAVSPGVITYTVTWRINPIEVLGGAGAGAGAGSFLNFLPELLIVP
jgi:choice-of-anchor A domain-containing protein/RHS repeat-associated protein